MDCLRSFPWPNDMWTTYEGARERSPSKSPSTLFTPSTIHPNLLRMIWLVSLYTIMGQRGKDKTLQVGQSMDCSSPKSVLQALLATRPESLLEWRASYPYPQVASSYNSLQSAIIIVDNDRICVFLQNLLRNAAKSGCQTNYTYIPDIDMVPFPGMDVQLEEFLATPEVTCFFAQ